MEERYMGTDTSTTRDKVSLCIFILVIIWYTLLLMGPVISKLYIQQQRHVPAATSNASMAFPFFVILIAGAFVLFKMIFNSPLPLILEVIIIACYLIFIFNISSMESNHIEHYIRNPELKADCYKIVIVSYNASALCIPLIWYVVRYIKQTPIDLDKLGYPLSICLYLFPMFCLLFFFLLSILKINNLIPEIF